MGKTIQKIKIAQERSTLEIDVFDIISPDGQLIIDTGLNRGQIEVRQSANGLQLKIGGLVGRLPVTPQLALDIIPKFSIANLSHLISVSDEHYNRKFNLDQTYGMTLANGFLPEVLLKSFAIALSNSAHEGILRNYNRRNIDGTLRPKVDLNRTIQKFWSKGLFYKTSATFFDYSQANNENIVIKAACLVAMSLSVNQDFLNSERAIFVTHLKRLQNIQHKDWKRALDYIMLGQIDVPSFKKHTTLSIKIACEILRRSGISSNFLDRKALLPSFLINLESAFESYIRNILTKSATALNIGVEVGDGNKRPWIKPLLDNTPGPPAKPDIVIRSNNDRSIYLIGDVKYKRRVSVEDKYQVIAHALSYGTNLAVIFVPKKGSGGSTLNYEGQLGPEDHKIHLWVFYFDLSAHLPEEEQILSTNILSEDFLGLI